MRMGFAAVAVIAISLCLAGTSSASVAIFDFGTAGGVGYNLSSGGVLSFDHLKVTDSSNGADILSYVVEIGNLTIDTSSRSAVTVAGMSIVTYGFSVDTTTFQIFDAAGVTELLSGTLKVDVMTIINGAAVSIDADQDMNDITGIATHNGATEQTLLDMAAIGVAGFTLTLSVAPPTNFDLLVQNSTAGSGAVEGSVGAVPEPATLGLLAIGVSAIFMRRRRSR